MKVQNISSNQSFQARMTVKAAESMLSREDVAQLVNFAQKIGKSTDTIEVSVGNYYRSQGGKRPILYDVKLKSQIGMIANSFVASVRKDKLTPKEFILKRLNSLK